MSDKSDDATSEPKKQTVEKATNTEAVCSPKKGSRCCRCLFWTFAVIVGIAAVLGGFLVNSWQQEIPPDIQMSLGEEGLMTFHMFDRNHNGYLEIAEFEQLFHYFKNGAKDLSVANFTSEAPETIYELEILPMDEVISLVPSFQPLLLSSMTMEKDRQRFTREHGPWIGEILYGINLILDSIQEGQRVFFGRPDPLKGLKTWTAPSKKFMNFAVRHFESLFPKPSKSYFAKSETYEVGKVYRVVNDDETFFYRMSQDFSSNRYNPPQVEVKDIVIHQLLTIFHPRPFIKCRFGPRGTVAAIRAKNEEYFDIVFRIHAEFQLNQRPGYPFWFTPGQFTGHFVVTRDFKHIEYFHMYVPSSRKLNVDMEWLEGADNMVVDIGYMPEMSLVNTAPSVPAGSVYLHDKLPKKKISVDDIKWTEEISETEALRLLEVEMYPFTKVPYHNFTTSLDLAKRENKYIHHILLWGALDDQSC